MEKTQMEQSGDYSVQIGENHGEVHIKYSLKSDGVDRIEAKVDQLQNALNILLSVIINSKDKELLRYVNEHLPQFDTITLDSYNGENTTHILIPVEEILSKPISPSIKKLITNRKVGLNYKGIDLQRDSLSVSNILSQMRDIDE